MLAALPAFAQQEVVTVTGTRLPGGTIDPDKLPGQTQSLSVSSLSKDRQTDVLPNLVAGRLPGVSLSDEQGSPLQPDFVYRGFKASPISGVAEGLAVYQNGTRINEAFGDAVNWDLVPEFAVDRFTLQSGNPALGLNALGGAVALDMKDGFSATGTHAQISAGSFGSVTGDAEYGGRFGDFGVYLGVGGMHDGGFRDRSASNLRQAYADIGYEAGRATLHLSLSAANDKIDAAGPTPIQMLEADRKSIFTHPQSMANKAELAQLRGTYRPSPDFLLTASLYYRHFSQGLVDGNTTDVKACGNDPSEFCLEGDGDFPGDALYDRNGNPVPVSALPAGATPGETDFSRTGSHAMGVALELSSKRDAFGHGNDFAAGASYDRGRTAYGAFGELGALLPTLEVVGSGVIIDQATSPTASPPLEQPVDIRATNAYAGLYLIDAFDLTARWTVTLSGRYNAAHVALADRIGSGLNGHHDYSRFDPGAGATYRLPGATFYLGYSQTNRAPTPGELSCADPTSPCILDTFLVDDPPLKQVVARTWETGLRGAFDPRVDWNVSVYRAEVSDDILLLATAVNGFGYFTNAGETRHQGFDASLGWHEGPWRADLAYSFLDATFRDALALSSNSPAADANGLIHVVKGDRIPLMPRNRISASLDYAAARWALGAQLRWQSAQYLAGDESNREPQIPGYATVGLHGAYEIASGASLFAEVENLFDRKYFTYGAFADLDGLPPNFSLSDPRTFSPAPGRLIYGGLRLSL